MSEKEIRFIDSRYQELFRIPDGGSIRISYPDRQVSSVCEYLDDYHTRIGGTVYHIRQFAEQVERSGAICQPDLEMKAFLDSPGDAFAIFQLRYGEETDRERFLPLSSLHRTGMEPDFDHYDLIYFAPLVSLENQRQTALLEDLFTRFNIDHPAGFAGHSLSVSDVVALKQSGRVSFYYVDSFGFQELTNFAKGENDLKNAEMSLEDDYDMIDGILNNGRSAVEAERPSVLKRLKEERPPAERPPRSLGKSKEPER